MTIRHFLSLEDLSDTELRHVLNLAARVKKFPQEYRQALAGQTLAMIFQKKSTRTRVSFEVGMFQLGGHALFLGSNDIQIGRGETISDTAQVLGRYCDLIMARVYGHKDLIDLAENAGIPVINGLSDALHPCQVVADLQTMQEQFDSLEGRTFTYVGDGNNMAHSLMLGCSRLGMNVQICAPAGYEPEEKYTTLARGYCEARGQWLRIDTDPNNAGVDADVVYTDVWASMGQESEQQERLKAFAGFEVDDTLMARAKNSAIFMHCLPAHRGEEVSASVCDGPQSVIFDEAENRLHAQKALMLFLAGAS